MVYEILQPGMLNPTEKEILVLGVTNSGLLPAHFQLPEELQNYIIQILKNGEFDARTGNCLLLYPKPNERIILLGCQGKNSNHLSLPQYLSRLKKLIFLMKTLNCKIFNIALAEVPVAGLDHHDVLGHFVRSWEHQSARLFSKKQAEKESRAVHQTLKFVMPCPKSCASCQETIVFQASIGRGLSAASYLADQPPNLCTPEHISMAAQTLAEQHARLSYRVLNEETLRSEGLSGYLAVGEGSKNRPKLSILMYEPPNQAPTSKVAIIGKGLTFDSGGISLKPAAKMDAMKYDMCGAAAVLGIMQTVAELELPFSVVGFMAGCENMPDGGSYRPGDILKMHNGKHVEVLNTDAEGRIVLADALSYAQSCYRPDLIIDIATLTGACVVALGNYRSGLFTNQPELSKIMGKAAEQAGDPVWTLPLDEVYEQSLESEVADLTNCGGREGGSITAARFLLAFINETPWIHLDIAGTAYSEGKKQRATGRPVGAVVAFLKAWYRANSTRS